MTEQLSDRFREAIPGWKKKERAAALVAIQEQIVIARRSVLTLRRHVVDQSPNYQKFWDGVLAKRRQDVEELRAIKRQFAEL